MPPPKTSTVWKFFIKDEAHTVRCKLCHIVLKFVGNTTNLSNHLKRKHHASFSIASTTEPSTKSEPSTSTSTRTENEESELM